MWSQHDNEMMNAVQNEEDSRRIGCNIAARLDISTQFT